MDYGFGFSSWVVKVPISASILGRSPLSPVPFETKGSGVPNSTSSNTPPLPVETMIQLSPGLVTGTEPSSSLRFPDGDRLLPTMELISCESHDPAQESFQKHPRQPSTPNPTFQHLADRRLEYSSVETNASLGSKHQLKTLPTAQISGIRAAKPSRRGWRTNVITDSSPGDCASKNTNAADIQRALTPRFTCRSREPLPA